MTGHCLIVIDLLHDFLDRWDRARRDALIEKTNTLVDVFRASGAPIIWVRQEYEPDLSDAYLEMRDSGRSITIAGTRGAQIHEDLAYRPDEPTIVKKRYSAFFGTGLDGVLAGLGSTTLVLAGVNTHACIRMTAIDAYQRDLRVVVAAECTGSYDEEHAHISLRYLDGKIASVMSNDQIIGLLKPPKT
jgi:nicotinamidase-related amidase